MGISILSDICQFRNLTTDNLTDWFLEYKANISDSQYPALFEGCKRIISKEKFRKQLANDSEHYFIKTHERPYDKYFDGEYVVQIVRNPGLSFWSFYNFHREVDKVYNTSLTDIIEGHIHWGSWSDYYSDWYDNAHLLKNRYLFLRYEDLKQNEMVFCSKLSKFTRLPMLSSAIQSFQHYQKINPKMFRQGLIRGWEKYYSKKQLKLLWNIHGKVMQKFGYPEPAYQHGLEKDIY